jgi:acetyl esterase/lipase
MTRLHQSWFAAAIFFAAFASFAHAEPAAEPVGQPKRGRESLAESDPAVKKPLPPKTPDPTRTTLFDGKSLAGWKVLEELAFEKHGKVEVRDGELVLGAGNFGTGIVWKGPMPRDEYELTLQARRREGSDFFCGLTFPVGEGYCTLILGGWGGSVTGLSNIDGFAAVENETTGHVPFKNGQWYAIRLRVTKAKIEAWVDKEQIVDLKRDGQKFAVWWEQEPARPLGIATWETAAGFKDIQLVSLATDEKFITKTDIEYARAGEHSLKLDLYLPTNTKNPPLVIWVHGGAWRSGSKANPPLVPLVAKGYALASVDYRLSPVAPFPAQAHDLKAAIRFLRAKADEYGYDPDRIAIAGGSAGGHLAALVGTTNGHKDLEGQIGGQRNVSSDVQAIVSFYGMSNLTTILAQSTPHGLSVRVPALDLLLGGQPDDKIDLAKLASPVFHVDKSDPPLFLLHGDQDPQAPINQSHELVGVYRQAGRPVEFEVLHGSAHGGKAFYDDERLGRVVDFLEKSFRENSLAPPKP